MRAEGFPGFAETGWYYQLTLGRELLKTPHYHNYYEIICLISGNCVHMINDIRHEFRAGEMVILSPGDIHYFVSQSSNTSLVSISLFTKYAVAFLEAFELETHIDKPVLLTQDEIHEIEHICYNITLLPNTDSSRIPMYRILLGKMLAMYSEHTLISVFQPLANSSVSSILVEALQKITAPELVAEGVAALRRLSKFSRPQLCRLTKQYYGKTPNEIVTEIRMKYANELLLNSQIDCETISETVGYSSYSHFCSLYRRTFGKSPLEARKEAMLLQKNV